MHRVTKEEEVIQTADKLTFVRCVLVGRADHISSWRSGLTLKKIKMARLADNDFGSASHSPRKKST